MRRLVAPGRAAATRPSSLELGRGSRSTSCSTQAASRALTTNQPSRDGCEPVADLLQARLVASAARYPGSHDELQPSPGEAPSRVSSTATSSRSSCRPSNSAASGTSRCPSKVPAAFEITRANTGTVFTPRLHRPPARAVLPLPRRRRARGADQGPRVPGGEARGRGDDDAVHRRDECSTSRSGRATRSRSRCRTRSSAAPTAPASAPSAART